MRILKHPLLLSALAIVALYVLFGHLVHPPLPRSLLIQYMVIVVIGVLLVATFNDATAKRMADPITALFGDPALAVPRYAALLLVMGGVGYLAHGWAKPDLGSPIELRTVHPAPPSTLKVYGKKFDLLKLTNPLRGQYEKGSEDYREMVREGGDLYYQNCIYCHGDLLDGKGHFANSFNPLPANFQDVGTIAQLQESYLFWRITTGGPGLPREGTPWASAMPVWHEMLSEEEVWKIITFLYDYTGHVPRSWEKEDAMAKPVETAADAADGALDEDAVFEVYMKRCAHCHGEEGDGLGAAAERMYPLPRDFTYGVFKYKTTHADDEFPTDEDLRRTIIDGLPGTSMPAWKGILNEAEIAGLIHLIKQFGAWDEEEVEHAPIDEGTAVTPSPESIAKGEKLFVKACVQCHGEKGRGNVTSGKKLKDDWENRIWPRNLTRPESWRATATARDVFQRISAGLRGTPMPEHTTTMSIEDRWHVANYVMTLRENAVPLSKGETVVRGKRVEGELPTDAADPAWAEAPAITFPLAPNIIKEPRLFFSLNETVTVRALFNDRDVAVRVDVDDRTRSVPGHADELAYRIEGIEPTRDALGVQFPVAIPTTSEKPWFRHGDRKHPVNMWYWAAPSVEPEAPSMALQMDAAGPGGPPVPRADQDGLAARGAWKDGRWQVVFKRALSTDKPEDLQFEAGRYIPVAFANWDGVVGEAGGRHTFTTWYWLLLEPEENPAVVYGTPLAAGLTAGLLFLLAARRQRRKYVAGSM